MKRLIGRAAWVATVWLLAWARAAAAQVTVDGVVVDDRTGRPLARVMVAVEALAVSTESDSAGRFQLTLPPGSHTVAASLIGFVVATADLVVVAAPVHLTIRLAEGSGAYTEQVTVAGEDRASTATPGGEVIYSRELQAVRGLMFDDPLRALQALPSTTASDDFYGEFAVRGSTFRHIGLALDGMPARYLMHTVHGVPDSGSTLMFNSDALESAALQPGSYPQRLGRRLGAEVDLTTRDGSRDKTRARAGLSGSSATLLAEGPLGSGGRGSWLGSIRRSYLDYLVTRLDDESFTFRFSDAQAKVVFDVTPSQQLQALTVVGRSRYQDPSGGLGANDEAQTVSQSWLSAVAWRFTRSRALLTQRVYVTGVDFSNLNHERTPLDVGRSVDVGWRADATVAASPSVTVEAGGDGQHLSGRLDRQRTLDGATEATALVHDASNGHAASAYALVSMKPSPAVRLAPGVRIDYWGPTATTTVSPWGNAAITLSSTTRLQVGAGRFRQFPEFDQLLGLRGGRQAQPESAVHVDASLIRTIAPLTTIQITTYLRRENHVLWRPDAESRRSSDGSVQVGRGDAPWINGLSGRARGVELLLRRDSADRVSGWVGYAFGQARYRDAISGEAFWADADQRHTASAVGIYRLSGRSTISAKYRYGSNYPIVGYIGQATPSSSGPSLFGGGAPLLLTLTTDRNTIRLPAYSRLDLRADRTVHWGARRLTLFVEVVNVLNRTNLRNVPYGVDRNGRVSGATDALMPILPSAGFVVEF